MHLNAKKLQYKNCIIKIVILQIQQLFRTFNNSNLIKKKI